MDYVEQTEIARRLGISKNALCRILHSAGIQTEEHFVLINNKRHYSFKKVIETIQAARHE